MELKQFIVSSESFFDYLEKSLQTASLLLIGRDHESYLQKAKEFWLALDSYGKQSAQFNPLPKTRAYYICFRNITCYIEVCFENEPLEFFKVVKSSRKKIFSNKDNFINLDSILNEESLEEQELDPTYIALIRANAKEEILKAVNILKQEDLDDTEIKDILYNIIMEVFE